MKERGILFGSDMVRAILDGRKTQTRRPVKPQPIPFGESSPFTQSALKEHVNKPWMPVGGVFQDAWKKPFGAVGDMLWVRETWGLMSYHDPTDWCGGSIKGVPESELREQFLVEHAANWRLPNESSYWRPSIHMPRWASRITLEITGVRVERLQGISEEDAKREGVTPVEYEGMEHPDNPWMSAQAHRDAFRTLWQSIYGNWDANPWVWVYEFRKI
jgi:hypothetical protein